MVTFLGVRFCADIDRDHDLPEFKRTIFRGAGCDLSALVGGVPDGPAVVILHGMRDHGASMIPIARQLQGYRLIIPDLRGHGDSDNPGSYGMLDFITDLRALLAHFELNDIRLIAHSLGGHIAVRYASLYPKDIHQLLILDGLGPPEAKQIDAASRRESRHEQWRASVAAKFSAEVMPEGMVHRPMRSIAAAAERLKRNNPRLSENLALLLAEQGVEQIEEGFIWKWDKRLDQFWSTFSHEENQQSISSIACPVLLVTGEFALEYWAKMNASLADPNHYQKQLHARLARFQHASSVVIPGAGHMLHYDQPEQLARAIAAFIS